MSRVRCYLVLMLLLLSIVVDAQSIAQSTALCPYTSTQRSPVKDDPAKTAREALNKIFDMTNKDYEKLYNVLVGIPTHELLRVECEIQLAFRRQTITVSYGYPYLNEFLGNYQTRGLRAFLDATNFGPYWDPMKKTIYDDIPAVTAGLDSLVNSSNNLPANVDSLLTLIIDKMGEIETSLDAGITALGDYNKKVNHRLDSMTSYQNKLGHYQKLGTQEIDKAISNYLCGGQEMLSGFQKFSNSLNALMADVMQNLAGYGLSKQSINNEIGEVIGTMPMVLDNFQSMRCKLWEAKSTGTQKQVKVAAVLTKWNNTVVGYMNKEFGKEQVYYENR